MDAKDVLRVVADRWRLAASVGAFVLIAFVLYGLLAPARYTSSTTLYVSTQTTADASQAYSAAQLSATRVKSYTDLISSDRVLEQAARGLRNADSIEDLRSRVTASSEAESILIDVAASGETPVSAQELAGAVSASFIATVTELERPSNSSQPPQVDVKVASAPNLPDEPSSLGLLPLILIGLVGGAACGVGGAVLWSNLDTSIRTSATLSSISGAPSLGFVAQDNNAEDDVALLVSDPQSPKAEAFRQIRTNLQFIDPGKPSKIIVLTSSVQAEGKSYTVLNLARALIESGARVVVVDADLRRPRVGPLTGLDATVGLSNILAGQIDVRTATQRWADLDVICSGPIPPNPSELLGSSQMADALAEMRMRYDYVVLDTPPLLPVTDAAALAPFSDGVVLLARYRRSDASQVKQSVDALKRVSARTLGCILTMVPAAGATGYGKYLSYYQQGADALDSGAQRPAATVRPRPSGSGGAQRGPQPFPRGSGQSESELTTPQQTNPSTVGPRARRDR